MTADTDTVSRRARIERQRRLPFSKAVEISLKSIKVRFWRSMLTVSSIVLAIAFLMWQLTSAEIVRNLEDVARDPARVDADAAPLKAVAAQRKGAADQADTDAEPAQKAFTAAENRLAAGKALAAVPEAEARLREDLKDSEAAGRLLEDEAVQTARSDYERVKEEKQRLERQLASIHPAEPQYDALHREWLSKKAELGRKERQYQEYLKRRTAYDVASARAQDARARLKAAREAADKARKDFPDQAAAPEGSPEYDRLMSAFRAARRARDRAEGHAASLRSRADRAQRRYESATHKTLVELLATKGERTRDPNEKDAAGGREVVLPLNLRLTSTRLWIISLALLVCLVGITNAMLMSVTERYREIGTMKCLGALDSFIVKIFLLESSFMGVIGVFVGTVLGFILAVLVQWNNFGGFVTRYFAGGGILKWGAVAFLVGAILSVLGGILPARRAARMAPVDAMRIEE